MIGDMSAPLTLQHTAVVVIDMQRAFVKAIPGFQQLADQVVKLVRGANVMNVKVAATEQYPQGLGETVVDVQTALGEVKPLAKKSFVAAQAPGFDLHNYDQIVLCGIETHICVLQTAAAFVRAGITTHVVADAVASRSQFDHDIALRRMERIGATLTTVEAVLFELLSGADSEYFKDIQELVR